jgi:hypothetical protein
MLFGFELVGLLLPDWIPGPVKRKGTSTLPLSSPAELRE